LDELAAWVRLRVRYGSRFETQVPPMKRDHTC
jgi:hypothetical protein